MYLEVIENEPAVPPQLKFHNFMMKLDENNLKILHRKKFQSCFLRI